MSKAANLDYEDFIREAFSLVYNTDIDRSGDPASLANTDIFAADDIARVKAGVSYSMCIYNNILVEENPKELSDKKERNMNIILSKVLKAERKEEIYNLIKEYKSEYFPMLNR